MDYKVDNSKLDESLSQYRDVLQYMGANVPIQVLCLPKAMENILLREGCLRVYDMINRDLTKIKGIGDNRIELLRSKLDDFFTVQI